MLLGGLAVGNADCAQERDPISQLQPGRSEKSFFVGQNLRDQSDNPEFYINNYIVASSGTNSLMPVGTYDETDRIIWEIQENVLLARKSYEYVTGQDGTRAVGQRVYQGGLVVAAYRIESHFDVRRAYNPTTGEELNVVQENMTDRPWYERSYMRVDWSQNLVENPDWSMMWFGTLFGNLSFQPVRYLEEDPRSPNAPNFCEMRAGYVRDAATGECVQPQGGARNHPGGYFDVTSKWLVSPEMNNAFGFPLPTCLIVNLFTGSDVYDCNPQETTVRTAFRRVEDRDFQPLELTQAPYDLVGGPRATRNGYDQGVGTVDQNFHRYAMIHNIWQRSHLQREPAAGQTLTDAQRFVACSSDADANSDGTADQCATAAPMAGFTPAQFTGSRCDTVMRKCTIPYRNREVRPIAYYITGEMPADFTDHVPTVNADGSTTYRFATAAEMRAGGPGVRGATEEIIDSWDLAVRRAIANAREVECRRIGVAPHGGDRATCHARFFEGGAGALVAQGEGAFLGPNPKTAPDGSPATPRGVVVCHNPVREDDSTACREVGYRARYGDLRYSHASYWGGFSRAPFGGIAHWSYDPLTGEVVANGALTMGRSVEFAAAQQRDFVRLILNTLPGNLDPLSIDQFVGGGPTASLVQALRNPQALRNIGSGPAGEMTPEQLRERVQSADHVHAAQNMPINLPNMGNDHARIAAAMQRMQMDTQPVTGPTASDVAFRNVARQLQDTPYEAAMLDRSWLAAAGVNPSAALNAATLERVSPLRSFDPRFVEMLRESIIRRGAEHGVCFQEAGAPPMVGSVNLQGVARYFARKYPAGMDPEVRARRMLSELRIDAYKGIQLHEVGHSIGLYHVPVSSFDSMNYNPQYWQLRSHNGTAQGSCRPDGGNSIRNANADQDNCMGPRWIDPYSSEELGARPLEAEHHSAGVDYFANTSTMEYQWERFGETVGLGAYDFYAMGILYGRVIETMDRAATPVSEQLRFSPRLRAQNTEKDYIGWFDPQLIPPDQQEAYRSMYGLPTMGVHYTELARQLNVFSMDRCRPATAQERARYRFKLVDGMICQHAPRDVAALSDMETGPYFTEPRTPDSEPLDADSRAPSWHVRDGARDGGDVFAGGNGPVRWHYRVAWDRGVGYPNVNYFDQGADIYEVTRAFTLKYDLSYPTMYFRRGRREWNWWSVGGAVASGMFRYVRGYHWNVARDISFFRSVTSDATFARYAVDDNVLAGSIAVQPLMFDFFQSVLLRPEPGDYIQSTRTSTLESDRTTPESRRGGVSIFDAQERGGSPGAFRVGIVDGRYIGTEVDNLSGGSWDYNSYPVREGADAEKPFAAIMLTDTRPTFSSITRNLFLDGREFQVNFFTDMPQAFDRLLGGIMAEDWPTVAMSGVPERVEGEDLPIVTPRVLPLWSDRPTRPAGSNVLFPNVGYRLQVPTAIYAMLYSSLNSELNTINKFRIWSVGGPEAVNVPEAEQVRFANPETGIIYAARRYGNDANLAALTATGTNPTRTVDRGIASRMIAHANELLAAAYRVQSTNPDGSLVMARDASGALIPSENNLQVRARAITAFRNYVGVVDAVRNISRILGYGLLR